MHVSSSAPGSLRPLGQKHADRGRLPLHIVRLAFQTRSADECRRGLPTSAVCDRPGLLGKRAAGCVPRHRATEPPPVLQPGVGSLRDRLA